jgi:hypothetical protein
MHDSRASFASHADCSQAALSLCNESAENFDLHDANEPLSLTISEQMSRASSTKS